MVTAEEIFGRFCALVLFLW